MRFRHTSFTRFSRVTGGYIVNRWEPIMAKTSISLVSVQKPTANTPIHPQYEGPAVISAIICRERVSSSLIERDII